MIAVADQIIRGLGAGELKTRAQGDGDVAALHDSPPLEVLASQDKLLRHCRDPTPEPSLA